MKQPMPVMKEGILPHIRSVVAAVYEGHAPEVLERLGIRVIIGSPRFRDNHRLEVGDTILSARTFVIATGSSPLVPTVPGLDGVPFLTNETLFDLQRLPGSLIILGGGPIGIEMAQAFSYLGVAVTVVEMGAQILAREDSELSGLLGTGYPDRGWCCEQARRLSPLRGLTIPSN